MTRASGPRGPYRTQYRMVRPARVKDPDDPSPLTGWVKVTGHECPTCHLPMTPYPGSLGHHPTCPPPRKEPQ